MKMDKLVLTDDSRPFTVLRKSAEDFNSLFNEGIDNCLSTLDSGIANLLCDPDSFAGASPNVNRLSAHMEFSKAKLELFNKMENLFNNFENDCIEQISIMKDLFLENVEIFLASTKLPISETSIIEKKRSPLSKVRSGNSPTASRGSSLYPNLFDAAKKQFSRFSSSLLLSADDTETIDDDEDQSVATPVRQNGKSPKRVTIVTPEEMEFMTSQRFVDESAAIIDISEESDEEPTVVEVTSRKPAKKPAVCTPASTKKEIIPARSTRNTPVPPAVREVSSDSGSDSKSANTPVRRKNAKASAKEVNESDKIDLKANTPSRRRNAKTIEKEVNESMSIDLKDMEDSLPPVEIKGRRATRSQVSTPTVATPSSISGRKTRTPRRKANASEDSQQTPAGPKTPKSVHFSSDIESFLVSAIERTPRDVQFSVGMDIHEDLDVYSPDVTLSRTTPRRKTTVLSRAMENLPDVDLTPDPITRGKSKRKTIAGSVLGETVAPSPKRLKMGRRSNIMPSTSGEEDEPMDSNSLASDGASEQEHYSPWMPLSDISGSVQPQPGIYELKVAAAKKPAYIGACDSLRQKLTLHKLKQNSGHKHLDKFIERNLSNILVRYEQFSTAAQAKTEEKTRVKAFVDRFKNPPAYN